MPKTTKTKEIEKIDIESLGEIVVGYIDDKPWTSRLDPLKASQEVAVKLNEVIEYLFPPKKITKKKS